MKGIDLLHILAGRSACLLCGTIDCSSLALGICLSCRRKLRREETGIRQHRLCRRCGMALLSEKELCTECRRVEDRVRNTSLYVYRGTVKDLIRFYKFQDQRKLACFFAHQIHRCLLRKGWEDWVLVPVPPGKGKIFRKGWDQIDLILSLLERKGWQRADLLLNRGRKSQKSLDRTDRISRSPERYHLRKVKNLPGKIIIIDDVFTTGATIKACTEVLLAGGAEQVRSLTIARD